MLVIYAHIKFNINNQYYEPNQLPKNNQSQEHIICNYEKPRRNTSTIRA
jgi:hypothetical protein